MPHLFEKTGFYAAQKLNHKKIKRKVAKRAVLFSSSLEISFDILKMTSDRKEISSVILKMTSDIFKFSSDRLKMTSDRKEISSDILKMTSDRLIDKWNTDETDDTD